MINTYAVITGASQGLGKSFALELAKRHLNLILVGLPHQGFSELCSELKSKFNIDVIYYETDLTQIDNVIQLANWINEKYPVSILINNAGIGGTKKFDEASAAYIESIIQLNVMATTLMTHQLLPNLKKQSKAYILNISSLAAFSPIGFKTVYPASKAFIHSFTRGLYQELKDTNVFVSVVNPGPMLTNAEISKRIKQQGLWGRLTSLDPDKVAATCITQIFKRDSVIVVNPLSWLFMHLLPIWIKLPLLTNAIKRELNIIKD